MNWKRITLIVTSLFVVAMIGYDVFAVIKGGTDATISAVVLHWSKEYLIIPFALGALMGHLFWSQK